MHAPAVPGWLARELPFRRRQVRTRQGRIHLIDEGDGPAVLLVHGNPMWSYLWRLVIPDLLAAGLRVVAPDLLGFGLSDRLASPDEHRLDQHVAAIASVLKALQVDEVIGVGQDWGGPICCGSLKESGVTVRGLVLGNTAVLAPARPFRSKPFHRFSHLPLVSDAVFVGLGFPLQTLHSVQGESSTLNRQRKRAYRWPFRRFRDRAGPLGLARMVPDSEEHPSTPTMDAIGSWVEALDVPTALVWGRRDPILGAALRRHRRALPRARVIETDAGHFLQEEVPELLAEAVRGVARA